MLTYDDFDSRIVKPDDLEKLFELNPNRKEYVRKINDKHKHGYVFVEDVLVNPYDVRDFLIQSSYIAGTNNLVPDKTGAPGMQQPVANEWVKPFVLYLRSFLYHKKITSRPIEWQDFCCYCNVFWKGMMSMDSNYRPHVDPGDFAFNLFLSDDLVEGEGTAMFSITTDEGTFLDVKEMEEQLRPSTISQIMDIGRSGSGNLTEWISFMGDDVYNLEGVVPAEFNCLSGYKGSYFHTAVYDPSKYPDGHYRYSLVAMLALTHPPAGRSAFLSKRPAQGSETFNDNSPGDNASIPV